MADEAHKPGDELDIDVESVATQAPVKPRRANEIETLDLAPHLSDLLIGKLIAGRYRLEKLIAKGGMGRVYQATQMPLGRKVAVKVLAHRGDVAADPQFVRRFFLEAAVCARLQHPNIVTVHDYGEDDDGELFMAMELLEGEPLNTVIKRGGALGIDRALSIALQVARALREAHARGVIHRDLKPGNIMLVRGKDEESGETVKVLDFGLVKIFETDGEPIPKDLAELDLTRAGVLLGSPRYMSPEQVKNEPLDPRTDIYSLGVILYHMVAGRPPFTGKTSIDIMHAHLHDAPAPLANVPEDIAQVIMRALEKSRLARYPTINEFIAAIKAVPRSVGLLSGPHLIESAPRPLDEPVPSISASDTNQLPLQAGEHRKRDRSMMYLGIALAAIVGVVLAALMFNEHPVEQPAPPSPSPPPVEEIVEPTPRVELPPPGAPVVEEPKPKKVPKHEKTTPKEDEPPPDIRLSR